MKSVKPLREVLRSPRFFREVSILLFGFAAITTLVSILLFGSGTSEPEALVLAVGGLIQAIVYVTLGILVRRNFTVALWITGLIFVLDTALLLVQPAGSGAGVAIVTRGILIFLLIRYIRREQVSNYEPPQ